MGNPLLDMQVTNGEALLQKYELKANDAILAEDKHAPIYDEVVKDYKVTYVAGGAAQNAARAAAYVLPSDSVVYTGCVGDDDLANTLKAANAKEGVESAYLVKKGELTGACAVILTGQERSLVTTLRSSEKFEPSHLDTISNLVDGAKLYYIGGFFLTHGVESALIVAKKAAAEGKIFSLNLSAPFIAQFFKVQLEQIFPYADIVIGNESEAEAYASAIGLTEAEKTNLPLIAKRIAASPKNNASRPRVVVLTHGPKETVLVSSDDIDNPKIFKVEPLAKEEHVLLTVSHNETVGSRVLSHGEDCFKVRAYNATACHGDKEGRDETMDARPPRGTVHRDPGHGATAAHHPRDPATGRYPANCRLR